MTLEPPFTKEELSDPFHMVDHLVAWFDTHQHGNPYFDAIQQSMMRANLRAKWASEAAMMKLMQSKGVPVDQLKLLGKAPQCPSCPNMYLVPLNLPSQPELCACPRCGHRAPFQWAV